MANGQGYKNRNGFNTISYMTQEQEKPHFKRFKQLCNAFQNGKFSGSIQDGLPVSVEFTNCSRKDDLTKDIDLMKGGE